MICPAGKLFIFVNKSPITIVFKNKVKSARMKFRTTVRIKSSNRKFDTVTFKNIYIVMLF